MGILKKLSVLPAALFCAMLLIFAWSNRDITLNLGSDGNVPDFQEYRDGLENRIQNEMKGRYYFINLNGLMAKCLGMNHLNGIQRLDNQWLTTETTYYEDTNQFADKVAELSKFLEEKDIGFLCVPIPSKTNFYDIRNSSSYDGDGYWIVDEFCCNLQDRGVAHINMDDWFEANDWSMEDTYFQTDHHWRPEAAFVTAEEIMKSLSESDPSVIYDPETFAEENWNRDVYPEWFLGSWGKRTGSKYVGVDDLSHIYPAFSTDMYVDRIRADGSLDVDHDRSVYMEFYLEEPDYFHDNPYCLYLGGDYPLIYMRNKDAVNDKKVVIIGDSYRLPLEAFLTTQFTEIYHIDMRHYKNGTFLEFVQSISPDYVFDIMHGPSDNETQAFGLEEWSEHFQDREFTQTLVSHDRYETPWSQSANQYDTILGDIPSGSYKLSLEGIYLERDLELSSENPGEIIQIAVVNTTEDYVSRSRYFISGYEESQDWYFTVPDHADVTYDLVIYRGMNGHTYGNKVTVEGLSLEGAQ